MRSLLVLAVIVTMSLIIGSLGHALADDAPPLTALEPPDRIAELEKRIRALEHNVLMLTHSCKDMDEQLNQLSGGKPSGPSSEWKRHNRGGHDFYVVPLNASEKKPSNPARR